MIDSVAYLYYTETTIKNMDSEVGSMKLLGRIENRITFYNFFPKYELVDGRYVEITNEKLKADFPTKGAINFAYELSGKSKTFLEDVIQADLDRDEFVKNIYLVEIDNYDLEKNNNDDYRVKLDLERIAHTHSLERSIKGANDVGIYKVVTSESTFISDIELASRLIFIKEENIIENELVVLFYENRYYGPFKSNFRTQDGKFYIKTEATEKDFLISYYTEDTVEKLEFEKQAYYEDPHYTNFIHIIGEPSVFDVITDEVLLEKITDDISVDLAVTNPEEFARMCKNSPFFADNKVSGKRIQRLEEIINNIAVFKEEKRRIFDTLLKLYQEKASIITDDMIRETDIYKEKEQQLKEKNDRIKQLEQNIEDLRTRWSNSNKSDVGGVTSKQVLQYETKIEQMEKELSELSEIHSLNSNINKLQSEIDRLKNTREDLYEDIAKYKNKKDSLANEVRNTINEAASNCAKVAFEPYISSTMLEAAAQWNSKVEAENYTKCKKVLSELDASLLSGDDLRDYIVKYVQARRAYRYNDIINIYINIAQNFITIFSGEPGTGKTSICNIIAETLGLLNFGPDINRFVSVSVEQGWSSKRDLIGYFNPLTKKYDKSNSNVYDALMKLDTEKDTSTYPFFIMLDEANLSPIEYYWADFMRLTDRSSTNDCYINIGTERELYVPETLRFLATINTDQTTESLSPRLIDRACIIKLPKVDLDLISNVPNDSESRELITWSNFFEAFSSETKLSSDTEKILKEIYSIFNDCGMNVSPRIHKGIEKYIRAAQNILVEEEGAITSEIAIDYAVIQKLLPKINGYYSNYERFFDSMKQLCKEYHLRMTNDAIKKIIEDQERNMGYCQYLI